MTARHPGCGVAPLGLLHLTFHDKNIHFRTTVSCESSCDTAERFLLCFSACFSNFFSRTRKIFQAETSSNSTLPLSQTYICKKILEQSVADDYSREVVLFLDRAMLSDQAEAAAEGNLQLPEGAAFFPLHNLRRSECHRSAVRLMLGR